MPLTSASDASEVPNLRDQENPTNFFLRQPEFTWNRTSVGVFLLAAFVAWEIHMLGQVIFPSRNWVPYLIRTTITLAANLLLFLTTVRLLEKNHIPASALGLTVCKSRFQNLLLGALIGAASLALIAALLRLRVPFHFQQGTLSAWDALKQGYSYLLGNSLEELIFRGFLFLVLSRLWGWRIAVLATAILFGLFHLQGSGISMAGLKIAVTTAIYSLVFSLSFVLTRSLWTAICVHATSNILLHTIFGLDGMNQAILMPVFSGSSETANQFSFEATILGALAMSCLLYTLAYRSLAIRPGYPQ